MAFAGQPLADGLEQRLTHMQRDGTPARESNSASTSADAVGSPVAGHLGHGNLRMAGVMTGYRTRWAETGCIEEGGPSPLLPCCGA